MTPSRIERRSIDVVPDTERHGSPVNQFTQINNYYKVGTDDSNAYRLTLRGDHNFSNNWRTFLRLTRRINETVVPNYWDNPGTPGGRGTTHGTKHAISWDHTITVNSTTIVNVNYGLSRLTQLLYPPSTGWDPTTIGFPAYVREQAAKRRACAQQPQGVGRDETSDHGLGTISTCEVDGLHPIQADVCERPVPFPPRL